MSHINKKSILQFVVFTSIGLGIMWYVWDSYSAKYVAECMAKGVAEEDCSLVQRLLDDYRGTDKLILFFVCLIFMGSNILRALQWRQLVNSLGYNARLSTAFHTTMIGYLANMIPPRIGELIKAGMFANYEGVPYEKALGTMALTRIMDVICLATMMALGFLLYTDDMVSYLAEHSPITVNQIIGAMAVGVVGLIAAIFVYRYLNRVESQNGLFLKVRGMIDGFVEGIISLREVENKPLFFGYSIGIWAAYLLMHWVTFWAYEPTAHLTLSNSVLAFDFGALGMVIPSAGGMGPYQALLSEALQILGIGAIDALSFSMIAFFTINIFCNVLFGLLGLIILPLTHQKRTQDA